MKSIKIFLYSFKKSLFDRSYYKDIAKATFGFSFKYLWFLLLILFFIKSIFLGATYLVNRPLIPPAINKFMKYASGFYPKNLELKVINGKLSTNAKEPYVVDIDTNKNTPNIRHFLIIDTKGSIDNYPAYNTYVLATKNAVVYPSKSNNNQIQETQVFYFDNLKNNITVNKNAYDGVLNAVKPYVAKAPIYIDGLVPVGLILFIFFGSLFLLAGVMAGLVFLTFFVWILNKIAKKNYNYSTLYRLGMHGVTAPIIVSEIMNYMNITIPATYIFVFFLWMMVVLFS